MKLTSLFLLQAHVGLPRRGYLLTVINPRHRANQPHASPRWGEAAISRSEIAGEGSCFTNISPSPGLLAALANHPLPNGERVRMAGWLHVIALMTLDNRPVELGSPRSAR